MKNADKPAYPTDLETEWVKKEDEPFPCGENKPLTGLTKRERFAMAAIQGLLSNSESVRSAMIALDNNGLVGDPDNVQIVVASNAVAFADALLKELEDQQ